MIGSTLAGMALDEGHEVISVVRPGSCKMTNLPSSERLTVIECEISKYGELECGESCDIFFHLAWDKTFGKGRNDTSVQVKNIEYALDAVNLADIWGASAFIGAGSQAEYGPVSGKMGEHTPINPISGYGVAKYSAGRLAGMLCREKGIRFCWTRILSTYGINDSAHTLIMYLIDTLLKGASPELTECGQMWDYIYSDDVARALLLIGMNGRDGRTYPIGSGDCRPLKNFVCEVRDIIDPNIDIRFGDREYYPDQAMTLCADIGQLTEDTGFVPSVSFREGIERIVNHVSSTKQRK